MTTPTFTPLQKIIETAADIHGVNFRARYSGRGMGGRVCLGLVGTMTNIQSAIAEAHSQITDELFMIAFNSDPDSDDDDAYATAAAVLASKLHSQLGRAYHDSMGRELVIYWPQLQPLEGQQDIEGEKDDGF